MLTERIDIGEHKRNKFLTSINGKFHQHIFF